MATAAAANTSSNRKWIYLLIAERHRWQTPAAAPLITFRKRSSGIITSANKAAAITSNHNYNYFSTTLERQ
jgi:hypothetical protein